jgi:hypothetical protein
MIRIDAPRTRPQGDRDEEALLRALIIQAYDLKGSPYFVDAVAAIVDAFEREPLARLERKQGRIGSLVRLLRETDPNRIQRRKAA